MPSARRKVPWSKVFDGALWLGAAGIVVLALWPNQSGPKVGVAAPAIDLPRVGAPGRFHYDGTNDRPLLIEAFASWCGACRRSAGAMDAVAEATREGKLDAVAISVDDQVAEAGAAQREWPILLPVLHDENGSFQRSYSVRVLPTFILVSAGGEVIAVTSGPPGASDLRQWLNPED